MSTLRPIFVLIGAAMLLVTAPAYAQQEPAELDKQQLAIARALFEEGLQFMDAREWKQAADRFARVLQMRWSPVVAYNLGSAQVELGEIGQAVEQLRKVLQEPDLEDSVRVPAEALLKQAEGRMGSIRVTILGTDEALTVLLDGSEWPQAALGVAVPLSPGRHSIVLTQGAEVLEAREIFLTEREELDVAFDRSPEEPAVAPAPAEVAAAAAPAAPDRRPERGHENFSASNEADDGDSILGAWWLWTSVGVAVVATIVTVAAVSAEPDPANPIRGDFMPGVVEGKVR